MNLYTRTLSNLHGFVTRQRLTRQLVYNSASDHTQVKPSLEKHMNKQPFLAVLPLLAGLIFTMGAQATETREISWDDLVPAEAEFDDPFTQLDEEILYELSLVASVRDRLAAGEKLGSEIVLAHEARERLLREQGVDVDGLIAMRDEVAAQRQAKLELTNAELEGQKIRIPGYLLPLEFDGDKVSEFFLVPYVGACIHTPPPPPNQIVHVVADTPFPTDGGLYTPVWVDGTLRSEKANANLSYVDGASEVPSSYALTADSVVPYE